MTNGAPSLPFLHRHARVWLDAARVASLPADTDESVVRHAQRGLPFVMRRILPGDPPGTVPLALRLPLGDARRGLAFHVARQMVARTAAPLSLADVQRQTALPAAWLTPLAALQTTIAGIGVTPRVYGSLAWQCMTGQPYLRDGSDIDLLLRPESVAQAHACLAVLQKFADALPLDGEIELPDGRALAWKELVDDGHGTHYVLVKSAHGVALTKREAIWQPRCWN